MSEVEFSLSAWAKNINPTWRATLHSHQSYDSTTPHVKLLNLHAQDGRSHTLSSKGKGNEE